MDLGTAVDMEGTWYVVASAWMASALTCTLGCVHNSYCQPQPQVVDVEAYGSTYYSLGNLVVVVAAVGSGLVDW